MFVLYNSLFYCIFSFHYEVLLHNPGLMGLSLEPYFAGEFDVIVVGGGYADVPAAIAAARMGAKTALIQNRPVNCKSGKHQPESLCEVL